MEWKWVKVPNDHHHHQMWKHISFAVLEATRVEGNNSSDPLEQ